MAVNYKKFDVVFKSIDDHLSRQVDIMERMLDLKIDEIEKRARDERYDSLEENVPGMVPLGAGTQMPQVDTDGFENYKPTPEQEETMMNNIIPGVGLGIGAGMTGLLTRAMGKIPMFALAGVGLALKEPTKDFLSSFLSSAINELDPNEKVLSPENKKALSDGFSTTVYWGAIGKLIGGRAGLGVALGGIIYDSLYGYIENNDTELSNWIQDNVNIEMVAGTGGVLGFALGGVIAKAAVGALAAVKTKGISSTIAASGFLSRLALPGLMFAFGDDISNAIASQFENKDLAKEYSDVFLWSTSLGSMFGPKGAIVGAVLGIAYGLGSSLVDYLQEMEEKTAEVIRDRAEGKLKEAEKLMREGKDDEAKAAYKKARNIALAEMERNRNLIDRGNNEDYFKPGGVVDDIARLSDEIGGRTLAEQLNDVEARFLLSKRNQKDFERYIRDSAKIISKIQRKNGNDASFLDTILDVEAPKGEAFNSKFTDAQRKILSGPESFEINPNDRSSKKTGTLSESAAQEKEKGANVVVRGGDTNTRGGDTHNHNNTTHIHSNPGQALDRPTPF